MPKVESGTLYYTREHEWLEYSDGLVTVGVSDHAQAALGDIVYVGDLPEPGAEVEVGDVIAAVESVKATSDVYSPVSGIVEEVNSEVTESPEQINQAAEADGWLIRVRVTSPPDREEFMDTDAYAEFCAELEE